MTTTDIPVFAGPHYLRHEDTYCYPLSGWHAKRVVLTDGWRLEPGEREASYRDPSCQWLVTTGPVTELQLKTPDRKELTGYRIKDPAAVSDRFPEFLNPTEWKAKGFDDDYDERDDSYLASRLYRPQYEAIPGPTDTVTTGGLTEMPGTPDTHPHRAWVADQPYNLIYSLAYRHLFPGHMTGLRQSVINALTARFGTSSGYGAPGVYLPGSSEPNTIRVTFRLDYESPQWRHVERTKYTRAGRKNGTTIEKVRKYLDLPINLSISPNTVVYGTTKADAAAKFDEAVTAWVEWVASHQMTVCSHCDGNGAIVDKSGAPS